MKFTILFVKLLTMGQIEWSNKGPQRESNLGRQTMCFRQLGHGDAPSLIIISLSVGPIKLVDWSQCHKSTFNYSQLSENLVAGFS